MAADAALGPGLADGSEAKVAVEAIARRFGATLEAGEVGFHARLSIKERHICLDVAIFAPATPVGLAKPRLRFDKVVINLIRRLRAVLDEAVPEGSTVVFAMAAPIRLAARTASLLETRIRNGLADGPHEFLETFHGNEVHVRVVSGAPRNAPRVVGFVHSPGADPRLLIEMSQSLLQLAGRPSERQADEHWFVLANSAAAPPSETWRLVFAQLSIGSNGAKGMIVFPDGRVEDISD
jgi:hypothetical protein